MKISIMKPNVKACVKCMAFAAAALAALTFTACGGDDDEPSPEPTPDPETPEWHLEWEDQFKTAEINDKVWRRIDRGTSDWNNNMSKEDVCYGWEANGADDGVVILRGLKRPDNVDDDQEYIVGGIETRKLKQFMPPFRLEIRCKLTAAQGAWPALWLMPFAENEKWPDCGEIDIMERLNDNNMVYQTVHSGYTQSHSTPTNSTTAMINGDDWNIYSITVTRSAVVWKVNGRETHRYTKLEPEVAGQFPFNKGQYLMMDMQLGGSWVGPVAGTNLPVEMRIDYVKYYRYY